jgi:hypothetical protein
MSDTVHAVYARIVGTIDVLSRLRPGASSDEGAQQRLAIDRAQALLRNALRELSESYAGQPDAPAGSVRLMGSAMVSPVAAPAVDLTFTAFLSDATTAAARASLPSFPRLRVATSTLFNPT